MKCGEQILKSAFCFDTVKKMTNVQYKNGFFRCENYIR